MLLDEMTTFLDGPFGCLWKPLVETEVASVHILETWNTIQVDLDMYIPDDWPKIPLLRRVKWCYGLSHWLSVMCAYRHWFLWLSSVWKGAFDGVGWSW